MPEETEPTPPEETSVEETPAAPVEETQPETPPVVDYEQRYNNLRPEFDRTKQRLAELEALEESLKDPEKAADVLGKYGYDLGGDDPDPGYVDPLDELRDQVTGLQASLQERDQQAAQEAKKQAEVAHISQGITSLEQRLGIELPDEEFNLVGELAERTRDEQGRPDVEAAYERLTKLFENKKASWASGKRKASPKTGPGAAQTVDLDDPQQRQEYIDRLMDDDS